MGYNELYLIANILDKNKRLLSYAKYYQSLKIEGLHYANFYAESNVISVCCPNHSTHHEATSFLLDCKHHSYSINTIRNYGNHLKKLLDYLMLWNLDIMDGDLLIILSGFVDYLQIIETEGTSEYPLPQKAIEWASITYLPIHLEARTAGKLVSISMNNYGFRKQNEWGKLPSSYISKILSITIRYFIFLRLRTNKYNSLRLEDLPIKETYKETFLSGTLGNVKISIFDIKYILNNSGISISNSKKRYLPLKERIPTVNEFNFFFSSLPSNKRQNKFLFHILKSFGLRESEAANLMIDSSSIPKNLIKLEYGEALIQLKDQLRGDIEFSPIIDKWVCKVINRNEPGAHYQSRNKSIEDRLIPLFFSQDEFSILLLEALKERTLVMKKAGINHSYLFISRAPIRLGKKITGKSVYEKLKNTLSKYFDESSILQNITPHTFRHYYASYCLRIFKLPIEDVQRYLGHQDKEITKGTYSHFLHDTKSNLEEKVRDISDTFRDAY